TLLTTIYSEIDKLPESIWKNRKQNEVKELIKNCTGLFLDLTTNEPFTTPNTTIDIKVEAVNRSTQNIILKDVTINNQKTILNKPLENQEVFYDYFNTKFTNSDFTNFKFIDTFNDFKTQFYQNNKNEITLEINDVSISFPIEIQYRYKDVVKGEIYKPFHVVPAVSVQFKQPVYVSNKDKQQNISVVLSNYSDESINGKIVTTASYMGLHAAKPQKEIAFSLNKKEKNKEINFDDDSYDYSVRLVNNSNQTLPSNEIKWINYNHIPLNYYIKPSTTKVLSFDNSQLNKQRIGYIMGAGDEIPQVLQNVGYQVDLIDLRSIKKEDLSKYETIVLGIRAFNTEDELTVKNHWLFDYTKNGGTVVVQYLTNINLKTENIAPFDLKIGKTRVTDEDAVVKFINPNEAVLNKPFKITQENFQNWVQEQGLYYADEFADEFQPVIISHDFDEKETNGALLIAKHGKGYYIYTGLSFFRQLPTGNIGALELFINLIELKDE